MGVRQRWIRVVPGTKPLLPPARLQYLKFLEPLKVTPLSREQAFKFRNFAKGTLYLNTNFILSKDLSKIIYTEPKYDALTAYPSSWGRSKPQHVGHQSRTPHGWHHFLRTLPWSFLLFSTLGITGTMQAQTEDVCFTCRMVSTPWEPVWLSPLTRICSLRCWERTHCYACVECEK